MALMSCESDDNLEFENDYSKPSTRYIKLLIIVYSILVLKLIVTEVFVLLSLLNLFKTIII